MRRLLFVHLAKTGGTSLRRLLKSMPQTSSFDCVHNGSFIRFRDGVKVDHRPFDSGGLGHYDVAVMMMRHPLARLSSCYHYFLNGGLNQRGKGDFPHDTATQQFLLHEAPTLAACCEALPRIAARIPHIQPVCHWLDQLPNPLADLVFTGRQESFTEDLRRFLTLLDLDPGAHVAERRNTSPPRGDDLWTPASVRQAEHFYAADFRRFGYEPTPLSEPQLIQYWDQPVPPPVLLERMERWQALHPGWRYQRYNRQSASQFIDSTYGSALKEAFIDIRLPAMQADVFRIAVLNAGAGVWIDAASTCHQPLDAWLNRRQPLVLLRRAHQQHPKVWNGFIYSAAEGHPLLVAAWQQISAALLARRGERVWRDFGPGLLCDLLAAGVSEAGLLVLPESELSDQLLIGSSSDALPGNRHWSQRQQVESLYLSGGSPSASQRSNDAS